MLHDNGFEYRGFEIVPDPNWAVSYKPYFIACGPEFGTKAGCRPRWARGEYTSDEARQLIDAYRESPVDGPVRETVSIRLARHYVEWLDLYHLSMKSGQFETGCNAKRRAVFYAQELIRRKKPLPKPLTTATGEPLALNPPRDDDDRPSGANRPRRRRRAYSVVDELNAKFSVYRRAKHREDAC